MTSKKIYGRVWVVLVLLVLFMLPACAHVNQHADVKEIADPQGTTDAKDTKDETVSQDEEPPPEETVEEKAVPDPLEPWNRLMFNFNDRLYFWVMKPAAKGYNRVFPEPVRVSVRNFFTNIKTPVRFVNCLLEARIKCAGIELARLGINSIFGIGGLFDIAKNNWHIESENRDTGQTLGYYGIGEGIYIVWPFLGPSSLRDTVGTVGDSFLTPTSYITPTIDVIGINAYDYFNNVSLHIGDYEDLIESAVEPYTALKHAYLQHRRSLIEK